MQRLATWYTIQYNTIQSTMIRFLEPRGHHNTGSDNFYYNYSFSTTTVHSLGIVNRLQTLHMTRHRMFDWQLDKRETAAFVESICRGSPMSFIMTQFLQTFLHFYKQSAWLLAKIISLNLKTLATLLKPRLLIVLLTTRTTPVPVLLFIKFFTNMIIRGRP